MAYNNLIKTFYEKKIKLFIKIALSPSHQSDEQNAQITLFYIFYFYWIVYFLCLYYKCVDITQNKSTHGYK